MVICHCCFTFWKNDSLRGLEKIINFKTTNPLIRGDFSKNMSEEKKFYLTKKGLERIKREYKYLIELKLAKTKGEESPKILHSEDLNPEYLAFQEDISFLEARIAELENIFKNTQLIRPPKKEKQNIVELGATVLIEAGGEKDEFEIIGSLEANPSLGKISNESPVGKALLRHKVGDIINVQSAVAITYKILKIKYK